MKIKVKKIVNRSTVNFNGKDIEKLQILTDDDQVLDTFAKLEEGQEYDGEITENKYGKQFKRTQSGGFGSRQDPETQKNIIRQNSLTNAVAYCVAKANLMDKKEALAYLNGKGVIQVATDFAKYSLGEITVVTEAPQPKDTASNSVEVKEVEQTDEVGDEVNLDDIPDGDYTG